MKPIRRLALLLLTINLGAGCSASKGGEPIAPGTNLGAAGGRGGTGGKADSSNSGGASNLGGRGGAPGGADAGESTSEGGMPGSAGAGPVEGEDAGAPPAVDAVAPAGPGFEPSQACLDKTAALLALMTADEKAAQLFLYERQNAKPSDITTYGLGGVLSAGGSRPANNSAAGWADEADAYRAAAAKSRLKVPIIFGVDAVHGVGGLRGATVFPHNIGVGATRDAALAERIGQVTAAEVAGCGMDYVFGPMIAVARDDRWGREDESFGETPELPRLLGPAVIRGLQGFPFGSGPKPVVACAKHFAGDGGTKFGSAMVTKYGSGAASGTDRGNASGADADLEAMHVKHYEAAIAAGVGAVMATVSSWNGTPGHANKRLITDVLKGQMKFKGFVTSDYDGIDQTVNGATLADKYAAALNAGIDMIMTSGDAGEGTPGSIPAAINLVKGLVPARVPQARIDDAVSRILTVKCQMKLFEADGKTDRALTAEVGSPAHRTVAREAVAKSVVVLKNEGSILPLAKTTPRIYLGGKNADDIGNQCGGWTIEWQGKSGAITTGTTIRKAIETVVGADHVTFTPSGAGGAPTNVGIAVIGETPYAEWFGDRTDLNLGAADVAVVKAMKDAGLKVVVVLVTGRPLLLAPVLALADAVVVAWLPGTEGDGVADVLFGAVKPTGKLPQSWPRSGDQVPINLGDPGYDPLFPYGYGLSYP